MTVRRVLHVAATSVPFTNGYTMRLHSIVKEQVARGMQATVVTSPFYPGRISPTGDGRYDAVEHIRCSHPRETSDRGLTAKTIRMLRRLQRMPMPLRFVAPAAIIAEEKLLLRNFAAVLRREVRLRKPDIIHAHTPYRCALPALQIGRESGIPVVYEVRGIWEDTAVADGNLTANGLGYRYIRSQENRALRAADSVIAICETLAQEVLGRGAPQERTFVAPNGADLNRLDTAPENARRAATALRERFGDAAIVGYVGSLRPLEGVETLVQAVAQLIQQGVRVAGLVVGDGPSLPDLKDEVQRLGIGDHFAFTGQVRAADIGAYYDAIDVFAVTRNSSRVTDLVTPIKPLEAMAREKPVLMSSLPSLRELGEAADAARYYSPGDVDDLAAHIAQLLSDPAGSLALGQRARAWVAKERTWARSVDATAIAYDAALTHTAE